MYEYSQYPLALWIICVPVPAAVMFVWGMLVTWRHWREIRSQIRFGRQ